MRQVAIFGSVQDNSFFNLNNPTEKDRFHWNWSYEARQIRLCWIGWPLAPPGEQHQKSTVQVHLPRRAGMDEAWPSTHSDLSVALLILEAPQAEGASVAGLLNEPYQPHARYHTTAIAPTILHSCNTQTIRIHALLMLCRGHMRKWTLPFRVRPESYLSVQSGCCTNGQGFADLDLDIGTAADFDKDRRVVREPCMR